MIFSKIRVTYPSEQYIEIELSFDTNSFSEAARLIDAFTSGLSSSGELRAFPMAMTLTYSTSPGEWIDYRNHREIAERIAKYWSDRDDT